MRGPTLLRVSTVLVLSSLAAIARAATPIAPNTFLIPGTFPKDRQPDGSSIVIVAPDGLIAIDTGRHETHTQQLIDFAGMQNKPIVAIINTHWHLDHIGGNALLRETYPRVRVYASGALEEAQTGFLENYRAQLEQAIVKASKPQDIAAWRAEMKLIDAGARLAPDETIDATSTRTIAGRKLVIHLERNAVTAGDVWVEDPATRVVVAGDLVTLPVPFFDTACPAQWEKALDHVAAAAFDTLIPGHGKPMRLPDFAAYRKAFADLRKCAASDQASGACAQQWIANAGTLIDPDDHDRVAPMLDYYLKHVLRADPASRPKYCSA
jgi:glyoxylase-like metal-dependent hydrolase (beta-lactamase superfamily II)